MRKLFTGVLAVVMMLVSLTGIATAQDGPSMTVSPGDVAEAGPATFTVTLSGYDAGLAVTILNCADIADLAGTCMFDPTLGHTLTPVTIDEDGNASAVHGPFDVPAEGIVILAGTADQAPENITFHTVNVDPNSLALTGPSSTSTIVMIGFAMFALGGAVLVLSRRSSLVTA